MHLALSISILAMLRLLVDTSAWLDLAASHSGQATIVPLRVLLAQNKLELLVPSLVVDEFERNRPRQEAAVTKGVIDRLNQLRKDLREFAGNQNEHGWLEETSQHIPFINSMAPQNFREIAELLRKGSNVAPTDAEYGKVVQRGLDKVAPFQSAKTGKTQVAGDKNCVADALLIEIYAAQLRQADLTDQHCFVTSNYRDFSVPNGDHRLPHPDLAGLFASEQSRYIYKVEGLDIFLSEYFGTEFLEEREEAEFIASAEEPRTLAEILDAEVEFFERVWYVRSMVRSSGEDDAALPNEIRAGMLAARAKVEARYGRKDLQKPIGRGHDKAWEYGYINGKLSALRWVLGSEWDFLDT
jgi:hypothetical protein